MTMTMLLARALAIDRIIVCILRVELLPGPRPLPGPTVDCGTVTDAKSVSTYSVTQKMNLPR